MTLDDPNTPTVKAYKLATFIVCWKYNVLAVVILMVFARLKMHEANTMPPLQSGQQPTLPQLIDPIDFGSAILKVRYS